METLICLFYLPALWRGMVARPTEEKTSAGVMPSQETVECVLQCYHSLNQNQLVLAFFFSTFIVGKIASWVTWDLLSSLKNWALCLFWFIFSKILDWDDFYIILRTGPSKILLIKNESSLVWGLIRHWNTHFLYHRSWTGSDSPSSCVLAIITLIQYKNSLKGEIENDHSHLLHPCFFYLKSGQPATTFYIRLLRI